MSTQTPTKTDTIHITRTFSASLEAVWQAWTNAAHFMKWWGPKTHSCPEAKLDVRVGGTYLAAMRSEKDGTIWSTGTYREVVPMERLMFTDSFADSTGKVVSGTEYGMSADFPMELLVTVSLTEEGGKTTMELTHVGFPNDMMEDCTKGWEESFDKLAVLLEKY